MPKNINLPAHEGQALNFCGLVQLSTKKKLNMFTNFSDPGSVPTSSQSVKRLKSSCYFLSSSGSSSGILGRIHYGYLDISSTGPIYELVTKSPLIKSVEINRLFLGAIHLTCVTLE